MPKQTSKSSRKQPSNSSLRHSQRKDTGNVECPDCGKVVNRRGIGPHRQTCPGRAAGSSNLNAPQLTLDPVYANLLNPTAGVLNDVDQPNGKNNWIFYWIHGEDWIVSPSAESHNPPLFGESLPSPPDAVVSGDDSDVSMSPRPSLQQSWLIPDYSESESDDEHETDFPQIVHTAPIQGKYIIIAVS